MKTTVSLRIGSEARDVELERVEGGWRVHLDGRAIEVRDVLARDGALVFAMDGRTVEAVVSPQSPGFEVTVRGRTWRVGRGDDESGAGAGAPGHGGDGTVRAPMPGSIVAVRVAPGDRVCAGDPVVVLESMKMQNELPAGVDGVVRSVACEAGQQVGFDDVLVEIDPAGDDGEGSAA